MACKKHKKRRILNENGEYELITTLDSVERLLFGIDSDFNSNNMLQNNLTLLEWARRNKKMPAFCGRNLVGDNCLTQEEVKFLHSYGCKIALTFSSFEPKLTENDGKMYARKALHAASKFDIAQQNAIFLEIQDFEEVTTEFMFGYASALLAIGYTPGFKANTNSICDFNREFSRGIQISREVFCKCLIWATSPNLSEYDRVTTTHLIHPDLWKPHAPSGISRYNIAIWQYGKNCHPISDDNDFENTFNINLVRNENIIIKNMI